MSVSTDLFAEVEEAVHGLKIERDTWQAVALQYKAAFEAQTSRLQELQDICFAAQADFENEKAQRRQLLDVSQHSENQLSSPVASQNIIRGKEAFGTAVVFSPLKTEKHQHHKSNNDLANPLFERVQQLINQRNYGVALTEIDRLLRGPLSSKARIEGLMLKSNALRGLGPDELYDALAACSEALELCNRLPELESYLPQLQYQRGLLYYELRMLPQAREAFSEVGNGDFLSAKARKYRRSCDDEIDYLRVAKRRSGFDENRTPTELYLMQLEEKTKRRRTSAQLRHAAAKAKRITLPQCFVVPRREPH